MDSKKVIYQFKAISPIALLLFTSNLLFVAFGSEATYGHFLALLVSGAFSLPLLTEKEYA
jgi:hypothetical protein